MPTRKKAQGIFFRTDKWPHITDEGAFSGTNCPIFCLPLPRSFFGLLDSIFIIPCVHLYGDVRHQLTDFIHVIQLVNKNTMGPTSRVAVQFRFPIDLHKCLEEIIVDELFSFFVILISYSFLVPNLRNMYWEILSCEIKCSE